MKPGDLVTIRKWNITHRVPITYVGVYDRTSRGEFLQRKVKWEHGDVGVLLDGRDAIEEMVRVLHKGHVVWIDEEMLRGVDEAG
jgi:hypothetical protein